MGNNYDILLSRIDEFRKKFYLNKVLRGLIYSAAILLTLYLFLFVVIYYTQPAPPVKTALFFAGLAIAAFTVFLYILKPVLAYLRLTKTLSMEEAARLIGQYFEPVGDKLLNTLQLKALADLSPTQNQLILAGIDQKIATLKPIPFSRAISLQDNKRYLKYFLSPLVIIIMIAFLAPVVFHEGTSSLIHYDKRIVPSAPFRFKLLNRAMTVIQSEDLNLELELTGDQIPQDVYLKSGANTFKLHKRNSTHFSYTLSNLQQNHIFYFNAGGFDSKDYRVSVKPRPSILNVQTHLHFPEYLQRKDEHQNNAGDLLVPEGTRITWTIQTEHTSKISFRLGSKTDRLNVIHNKAIYQSVIKQSNTFQIVPETQFSLVPDSVQHKIAVIADQHPAIEVEEKDDSLNRHFKYFKGNVSDDHGFTSLRFVSVIRGNDKEIKKISHPINIDIQKLENSFFYLWDSRSLKTEPGQVVEYYLQVSDNDALNGPKSTRSAIKTITVPTPREESRQTDTKNNSLKRNMSDAIKLAGEVERDSKKLGESLLDKQEITLENKKEINQLLDKQRQLEDAVKKIQQEEKKNSNEQVPAERTELELKRKQIDELFSKMSDPKVKALLEKLQQLSEQNRKDEVQRELSNITMDNRSLKNELDRVLELYKQLEFEQSLQDKISRLKTLSEKQKGLSKPVKGQQPNLDALKAAQKQNSEDFKALQKELSQLQQKNQALERPNNFQRLDQRENSIRQQQQQSLDHLQENQQQQAAQNQQNAGQEMRQMAQEMENQQLESEEKESELQTEGLRRLLQNLLQTSFDQEKVMVNLSKMNTADPSYTKNVQQQRVIKDNIKTIADSLAVLGKRIPQMESTVNSEVQQINFNISKSLENLAERRTAEAARNQQYTMSAVNNLALMLNEVLEQVEKNKRNAKSGGKGKGRQSMQQLQQMQQQLNSNMQQARDQLEKEGNKGTVPKGRMSEDFARMAQQQMLIREALQKINANENKDGRNAMGNLNQVVKDMQATENDLLHKRVEEATLKRQEQIMVKFLDAQQSRRERDEKAERESKAGRDYPPSYPEALKQYEKESKRQEELLQRVPPALNYYYKNKISTYFKSLNSQP